MNYCETCHLAAEGEVCPVCGDDLLRPVRGEDYCFLAEKEEMWANLFQEVLQNNGIPAALLPVMGAGVSLKSGRMEEYRIFVPYGRLEEARDLFRLTFGELPL